MEKNGREMLKKSQKHEYKKDVQIQRNGHFTLSAKKRMGAQYFEWEEWIGREKEIRILGLSFEINLRIWCNKVFGNINF